MKYLIILFLFGVFIETNSQDFYYHQSNIIDYIVSYRNSYSDKDINNYSKSLMNIKDDSLKSQLSQLASDIEYLASYDSITRESLINVRDFHYKSLCGLLTFNELIKRNNYSRFVFYYGAVLKDALGYYESSIYDYTQSINSNTDFNLKKYRIIGERGSVKLKVKDYYGAILDLSVVIDSLENTISFEKEFLQYYLVDRGKAYALMNNIDYALKDFNNVIYRFPDCGYCYFSRGITYIKSREKEKACLDFSKAGELGIVEAYRLINKYCTP